MEVEYRKNIIICCDDTIQYRVRNILKIKEALYKVVKAEKKRLIAINIILTDESTMLSLNEKYLGHDTDTDTITFPYNETEKDVFGDVYISIDRVRENAKTYGCHVQEELFRIMVHGTLHLCGYEDKRNEDEKSIMIEKQEKYIKMFHVEQK